jgi:tetratricopeptide (TPR) repeat protein
VVHGPALLPGTSKEWAEEAAQHFEAADYNSAVHSYYQALELLQLEAAGSPATTSGTSNSSSSKPAGQGKPQAAATQLMISLLLNTAAAELRLQQPEAALCHATAAEALDPGNVKAHHKVALALDKLQQPLAARAAMEVAADLHTADLPASQRGAAKARLLGDLSEAARAAKWGKVQEAKGERLKLEVTVEALLGSLAAGSMKMGSASSSSSCCKEAAAAAAASSKEAGTASFKQENYSAALQHYKQGLEQLQGSFSAAAELLASRAECWLSLGQEHLNLAVTDAAAAALLNPQLVNAHVYLGRGLLQLQLLPAAEAAVAAALQLVPGDAQLQQLQQRVASAGGGKQQPAATAARGAAEGSYHTTEPAAATSSSGRSNAAATRATGGTTSSGPDIAAGGGASTRSGGSSSSSRAPSTASGTGFGSGSSSSSSRSSGSGSNKKKGKNKKAGPTGPRQPDVDAIRQGMLEEEGRMADVEQVALMNNLMGMAQQFGAQLPGGQAAVNNQVPAVHEEFARLGRWVRQ